MKLVSKYSLLNHTYLLKKNISNNLNNFNLLTTNSSFLSSSNKRQFTSFASRKFRKVRKNELLSNKFTEDNLNEDSLIHDNISKNSSPEELSRIDELLKQRQNKKVSMAQEKTFKNLRESIKFKRFEDYPEINEEEISTCLNYLGFEFFEKENSKKMHILKDCGDFLLKVVFFPVNHNAHDSMDHLMKKYDNQDEDSSVFEDEENNIPVDIFIIITRKEKNKSFFFQGRILDGEVSIEHFYVPEDADKYLDNFIRGEVHRDNTALEYSLFDPELQNRFGNFINELGFNQEVIEMVENIAYYKEEKLFYRWFDGLVDIFKNKQS